MHYEYILQCHKIFSSEILSSPDREENKIN